MVALNWTAMLSIWFILFTLGTVYGHTARDDSVNSVMYTRIADPGPARECVKCVECIHWPWRPEQIHLAYGGNPNDMVVTWLTFNDTTETRVKYGIRRLDLEVSGSQTLFIDDGPMKTKRYIHRVAINNLMFNTSYFYSVGSKFGWSRKMTFKVAPAGEDWTVRAIIYGDMGLKNAQALPYIEQETTNNNIHVVVHVGDFAYDLRDDNGDVGDQFMRQIEPIAAHVPYMTCPGNHERFSNFSHYKNRFSMPGGLDRTFYSWNLGPVHFISLTTEVYIYYRNITGTDIILNQYNWLVQDLQEAVKPKNRHKRPWIIIYGHRPMICSNYDNNTGQLDYSCVDNVPTRVGIPGIGNGCALEPLLKQYGVDLVVWAHEHSYERLWPVYDLKVYNGSTEQPYTNPRAPVHIITSSAGCLEDKHPFMNETKDWSAFRNTDYGYTRLITHNKSHLHIEQVSTDSNGSVIDAIWLIKDKHEFT